MTRLFAENSTLGLRNEISPFGPDFFVALITSTKRKLFYASLGSILVLTNDCAQNDDIIFRKIEIVLSIEISPFGPDTRLLAVITSTKRIFFTPR